MRYIATCVATLGFGLSTLAASAMPIDAATPAAPGYVVKVAQGCGPGGFRGPGGHCRPRWSCPPGWHPGPRGLHCFANHGWRRHYY